MTQLTFDTFDAQGLFRWLHQHPELGHAEKDTTARLKEILQQAGLTFLPWQLPTGTAVVIEGGLPGKTVLLRADIDALPIAEKTDLTYKSQNRGCMHACGHDFHTTAVLGAALLLQAQRPHYTVGCWWFFSRLRKQAAALRKFCRAVWRQASANYMRNSRFVSGRVNEVCNGYLSSVY